MANPEAYTPNEVVAIIERLEGKFQFVIDIVVPMRDDMAEVKERLTTVEERLTKVEDGLRVGFPSLHKRLSALEAKVG